MSPSRIFILRPVATSLLMIALLLSGIMAYRLLPVSALPQVDYPTIQVVTFYPGASPEVIASSITAPLERQFGQMPGLRQMSSTSSGGASVVTLQFSLELDGFSVKTFANGNTLLDQPDLAARACLVIDYHMPALNGLELLRALRQLGIAAPAILITSDASEAIRRRATLDGAVVVKRAVKVK